MTRLEELLREDELRPALLRELERVREADELRLLELDPREDTPEDDREDELRLLERELSDEARLPEGEREEELRLELYDREAGLRLEG